MISTTTLSMFSEPTEFCFILVTMHLAFRIIIKSQNYNTLVLALVMSQEVEAELFVRGLENESLL